MKQPHHRVLRLFALYDVSGWLRQISYFTMCKLLVAFIVFFGQKPAVFQQKHRPAYRVNVHNGIETILDSDSSGLQISLY